MITTVPIKNEKDIAVPGKTVLVLGYFDGIHKGHQKLFEVASKASMKDYLPVVVMTFTESPKLALQPYQPELMLHIVNHEEREHKMKWHGVEALFLLDFSSKFASLTGQEFFDTYIKALKPAIIVAGFDYTFGSDKKTADDLKDYFDGEIIIVPPVEDEKGKISSTRIRQAILDGDVKESQSSARHSAPISWDGRSWKCSWAYYRLSNSQSGPKRPNLHASGRCLRSRYRSATSEISWNGKCWKKCYL